MGKLTGDNLRLLTYIRKYEPITGNECRERFGDDFTLRIRHLADKGFIENAYDRESGNVSPIGLQTTDKGRNALADAKSLTKEKIKDSILIPCIVALVTAILVTDLWPKLREWLLQMLR